MIQRCQQMVEAPDLPKCLCSISSPMLLVTPSAPTFLDKFPKSMGVNLELLSVATLAEIRCWGRLPIGIEELFALARVFPLALVDQSLCIEAMHSYKMALLHVCVQKYLGFRDWKFVVSTFFNGLEVCLLMCFSQTFQVTVNYYLCEFLQAAYERLPNYMGFLLVQRLQSTKISEWCSVLRFLQLSSLNESLVALVSSLGESVTF